MIIQSDFRDYYDYVFNTHRDNKIIFKRMDKDVHLSDEYKEEICRYLRPTTGSFYNHTYKDISLILFCGKIYPFVTLQERVRGFTYYEQYYDVYSYDNPYQFFKTNANLKQLTAQFGEKVEIAQKINKNIAPIVLIDEKLNYHSIVNINFNLRRYNFPLHANDVAQELMSFLSTPEPEIVEVQDKYKIQGHGYNNQSFRREKGGPTRKRKKVKII